MIGDQARDCRYAETRLLWTGGDDNPYLQMLAHAQTIVVTADSTNNMVGEACATSAPVMVTNRRAAIRASPPS